MSIGTLLIIILMITVKGYLLDRILPEGYITKKGWEPLVHSVVIYCLGCCDTFFVCSLLPVVY